MTDEVTALRRRYLLMATSAVVVDIAFTLVYIVINNAWSFAPKCQPSAYIASLMLRSRKRWQVPKNP